MSYKVRLLILGLDGASHRVVKNQINSLRNIKKLCDESRWGIFLSDITKWSRIPYTGPAWISIYTGVDHEKHGITKGGWLAKHKGLQDISITNIWEIISRYYTIGIMTMPVTYPAFPLNGWMVSGFPSPRSLERAYYPDWAIDLLGDKFFADYSMLPRFSPNAKSFEDLKPEEIMEVEKEKVNCLSRFMEKRPVDVVAIGFTMLDKYGHAFIQYPNPWLEKIYKSMNSILTRVHARMENVNIYRYPEQLFNIASNLLSSSNLNKMIIKGYLDIDELIGMILEIIEPANVIIISDHGISKHTTWHDLFGLYIIRTKSDILKKGEKTLRLTDIARNILSILDIDDELATEKLIHVESEYTESQHSSVRDQLRGLGYL